MPNNKVHPVCKQLRDLRTQSGYSLLQAQSVIGVNAIVMGSYERGDRQPTLNKAEDLLNFYGYTLVAVRKDFDAVRLPSDMSAELHAIADQIGKQAANEAG